MNTYRERCTPTQARQKAEGDQLALVLCESTGQVKGCVQSRQLLLWNNTWHIYLRRIDLPIGGLSSVHIFRSADQEIMAQRLPPLDIS